MSVVYAPVALGELLKRSSRSAEIDPLARYQEVTVRMWGKGVVRRGFITGTELSDGRRYLAAAGQFILSRIDARHGANGLIPPELDDAIVTNDFPLFDFDLSRLEPKYLQWLGRTRDFVELCLRASEGTTNRVRLAEDRFLSLTIPLPNIEEQRRIVAIVDRLSAKLAEATSLREQAVRELSALQKSWSRNVFQGLSCKIVPLEEACSAIIDNLHSTPTYREGGNIPCIRSPDVGFGFLDLKNARRTDEAEYRHRTVRGEPQPDDIVLVREGGGTGKCAIVLPGQRFSLGQRVMMLRPNTERVLPRYLLHQLLSPIIQEDHIQPLSKGSASPHLNIGALRQFPFALPTLDAQRSIVEELDDLQVKIGTIAELQSVTAGELNAMLPAILDQAFQGQL
jgi:type I restriction enzyme, S subunit